MQFFLLHPAHLLWGLLALPIVALYYWTLKRQREDVATFSFWSRALARRTPWSRWRRMVSLAVQLAVLALVVLAATSVDWSLTRSARTLVLVVDASASMKAADVAPSRFANSLAEARKIVSGLRRGEQAAVISADAGPRLLCGLTSDKKQLRQALDAIVCTDEPGEMESAVAMATRVIDQAPQPTIIVLTDGKFASAKKLAETEHVELRVAEGTANNVAITRLVARPSPVSAEHEVLITASNYSDKAKTVTVALSLGDKALEKISFELAANSQLSKVVSVKIPEGGLLTARLEPADDFPRDDVAVALVAPHREVNVLLVGSDTSPLAAALRAIPTVKLQVAPDATRSLPAADVTIFEGLTPKVLPAGGVLAIAPIGSCDLWDEAGLREGPVVVASQAGEPPLAGLDLTSAVMEDLVKLAFKSPARTLAATTANEPLASALDRKNGRVLVWHGRLDKSDLSQRPVFPLFVAQAVRWLSGTSQSESVAFTTGQRVPLTVAKNARQVVLPSQAKMIVPGDVAASVELEKAGVWQVMDEAAPEKALAVLPVNFDSSESNLQTGETGATAGQVAAGLRFDEPLWGVLLAVALVALLVDWYFLHRRVLV